MSHSFWPIAGLERAAFVDVDGTLVLWPAPDVGRVPRGGEAGTGEAPVVNAKLVERLRALKRDGWEIYVWSRGGTKHADRAVAYCGIADIVEATLPKPSRLYDDSRRVLDQLSSALVLIAADGGLSK